MTKTEFVERFSKDMARKKKKQQAEINDYMIQSIRKSRDGAKRAGRRKS